MNRRAPSLAALILVTPFASAPLLVGIWLFVYVYLPSLLRGARVAPLAFAVPCGALLVGMFIFAALLACWMTYFRERRRFDESKKLGKPLP